MFQDVKKRNLIRYELNADIHSEYADSPNHRLVVRIDVNTDTSTEAMYSTAGGLMIASADTLPYIFTLCVDDTVVAFCVYPYVTGAIRRWNRLAAIFGFPRCTHDGRKVHIVDDLPDTETQPN